MSKQDAIKRRDAGEDIVGTARVVKVFEEHYQLAVKNMSPARAVSNASNAALHYLQTVEESTVEASDQGSGETHRVPVQGGEAM